MAAPVGRPSKYQQTYCDLVIEHMADGASLTSFAAEIGVSRDTVSEWMSAHPEFSVSVKIAKAKCASWWERLGRSNAMSGSGNATLVIFGLKNMAAEDWREKQAVEHSGPEGGPIRTERVEVIIVDPANPDS